MRKISGSMLETIDALFCLVMLCWNFQMSLGFCCGRRSSMDVAIRNFKGWILPVCLSHLWHNQGGKISTCSFVVSSWHHGACLLSNSIFTTAYAYCSDTGTNNNSILLLTWMLNNFFVLWSLWQRFSPHSQMRFSTTLQYVLLNAPTIVLLSADYDSSFFVYPPWMYHLSLCLQKYGLESCSGLLSIRHGNPIPYSKYLHSILLTPQNNAACVTKL